MAMICFHGTVFFYEPQKYIRYLRGIKGVDMVMLKAAIRVDSEILSFMTLKIVFNLEVKSTITFASQRLKLR